MLLSALLVSTSFPVGETITDTIDPAALTLIRFVLAAVMLLPVIFVKFSLALSAGSFLRYSLISCCLVIFFWCMFLSLRYTTALNTSVLFTTVPALSGLYSGIIIREHLGKWHLTALFFGLFGALWVIFRGDFSLFLGLSWNRGDLIFFSGCLAMGLYTPLIRLLHRGEPMVVMTFWILVTGSIWLLPVGGFELLRMDPGTVPASTWLWIGYLAFFSTVLTFFLTQRAVPVIGPTRVMAYSYLYPAFVLIIDICLGRGWPKLSILPGIAFILAAMILLQRSIKTEKPEP